MNFYEKIGVSTLINASETYTNLGGSLMDPRTLEAMRQAGEGFVDIEKLLDAVCGRVAALTKNEAAFVTSGAAGGVILSAAACLAGTDKKLLEKLPQIDQFEKNEFLVFDGAFLDIVPYWRLIGLTGAKIRKIKPSVEAMVEAVDEHTAGIYLFPASLYEKGIPTCEETIPIVRGKGVPIIVDAAAQLPPASNLWYYTRELGADLVIFSGGKHIKGPQSTGLILGRIELISACRMAASPNPYIGRAFKTGKEELAGLVTALEIFLNEDTEACFHKQEEILNKIRLLLEKGAPGKLSAVIQSQGRLGTYQPLLLVDLPAGCTAAACNACARNCDPPVDIGVYPPEFEMPENRIFINAYNLKPDQIEPVAEAVLHYLRTA